MTMQNIFPGFLPQGLEEQEPGAAFRRGIGKQFGMQNPDASIFGRYLMNQGNKYGTNFAFNSLLNPPTGDLGANPFESYVGANAPGGQAGAARGLFGQLAGPTANATIQQQFAQPDEGQAGALGQLAQLALQSRISPLAMRLLNIPSGGDLRTRFLAEQPTDNNFINYVRNQMGLGLI